MMHFRFEVAGTEDTGKGSRLEVAALPIEARAHRVRLTMHTATQDKEPIEAATMTMNTRHLVRWCKAVVDVLGEV